MIVCVSRNWLNQCLFVIYWSLFLSCIGNIRCVCFSLNELLNINWQWRDSFSLVNISKVDLLASSSKLSCCETVTNNSDNALNSSYPILISLTLPQNPSPGASGVTMSHLINTLHLPETPGHARCWHLKCLYQLCLQAQPDIAERKIHRYRSTWDRWIFRSSTTAPIPQ